MKKRIQKAVILGEIVLLGLMIVLSVGAQPVEPPVQGDLWSILRDIIKYLFGILIIAGSIGVLIAGFLFITAQGDAEKVKTARNIVIYSLVGIIVGGLAYALVNIVKTMLGIGGAGG